MMVTLILSLIVLELLSLLQSRKQSRDIMLPTLLVDPLILIVSAIVMTLLAVLGLVFRFRKWKLTIIKPVPIKDGPAFRKRKTLLKKCLIVFFVLFELGVAGYYFGFLSSPYGTPGNDFAWNGYLDLLGLKVMDASAPTYNCWWKNAIAVLLFAVQPFFFWLGYRLGFTLGGFRDLSLWTYPKK